MKHVDQYGNTKVLTVSLPLHNTVVKAGASNQSTSNYLSTVKHINGIKSANEIHKNYQEVISKAMSIIRRNQASNCIDLQR